MASPLRIHQKLPDCTDLDFILDEFKTWRTEVKKLAKYNLSVSERLKSSNRILSETEDRELILKEDLLKSRNMVAGIQATLCKKCDSDVENRLLKKKVSNLEEEIYTVKKNHTRSVNNFESIIREAETRHEEEIQEQREVLTCKATEEQASLRSEVSTNRELIKKLQEELRRNEKEKNTEITRLKMEYDGKIGKLQTQLAKAQQATSVSANQDIFRKKLQHIKEESEQEISSLKATIRELQEQADGPRRHGPTGMISLRAGAPGGRPPMEPDTTDWAHPAPMPNGFNRKVATNWTNAAGQKTRSLSLSNNRPQGAQTHSVQKPAPKQASRRQNSPRAAANPLQFTKTPVPPKRPRNM